MMQHNGSPSTQMPLEGPGHARATDRLFFGVFPDANTAKRIASVAEKLREDHALQSRPLRSDRMHVTLHHLGDHAGLPLAVVKAASEAAARVSTPAFEVAFDSVSSFESRSRKPPCVLRARDEDVTHLRSLWQELGTSMKLSDLGDFVKREFSPHVTLMYDPHALASQSVDGIAWKVREFMLVHSLLGRSELRILGRWRLPD